MYYCNASISLQALYSIFLITFTLVSNAKVPISDKTWPNQMQDDNSNDKIIERYQRNEEFILLTDNSKYNQAFVSYNISSTTCQTVTKMKILEHTSPPATVRLLGHRSRRLLKEPSYDDNDIESFLKIDDEEMYRYLVNTEVTIDGSGESTEPTSEMTTISNEPTTSQSITTNTTASSTATTTTYMPIILSNITRFIITLDCGNINSTLNKQFENDFKHPYNVSSSNESVSSCVRFLKADVLLIFMTNNDITTLNNLFTVLFSITSTMEIELLSVAQCGNNNETVVVKNVTSCYLIDQCSLCGKNPPRGRCDPAIGLSKCTCFVNVNDPSRPYEGDLCDTSAVKPIQSTNSLSRWTLIIIGILASLTALFCVITSYLLIMKLLHHRRKNISNQTPVRIHRSWHLPRAQIPTTITAKNVPNYLDITISTSSTNRIESDHIENSFNEFDRKISEKRRTRISEASMPCDTISIGSIYDPIVELDAIIDNKDNTEEILYHPLTWNV